MFYNRMNVSVCPAEADTVIHFPLEAAPPKEREAMTIREIANILQARWVCCEEAADTPVRYAFASDMMSDVLAHVGEDTMLLTGLINSQSVRTAEMLDVPCLIFVRGKKPHKDAVQRAEMIGLPTLLTQYSMFEACGRLFSAGMEPSPLTTDGGEDDDDDD